jgi:hypothetical protein
MSRHDESYQPKPDRPSVYTLTDRQLANEYGRLTGASVQVPSSRNPASWWQWRSDLQERLKKERSSRRPWYLVP